jgi:hypothetical protein
MMLIIAIIFVAAGLFGIVAIALWPVPPPREPHWDEIERFETGGWIDGGPR